MLERLPLDRHAEFGQPRAIRLQHFSRPVHLLQHGHLFLMQRPPHPYTPLKRAQLPGLVALRMLFAQPFEYRLGFQTGCALQHRLYRRQVPRERVCPRSVSSWLGYFRRQPSQPLVLGHRLAAAQIRPGCRLLLRASFLPLSHDYPHLGVGCCHCLASFLLRPVYDPPTDLPSGHF